MNTLKPIIRTVCGDIRPANLGICYGHEHVLGQPPAELSTPNMELTDTAAAIVELRRFRAAGPFARDSCSTVAARPANGCDLSGAAQLYRI